MLANVPLIAFAATSDPDAALDFYRGRLGLRLIEDTPFALVFDAWGTELRIQIVTNVTPPEYTVLGWAVEDLDAMMGDLKLRGVEFIRFEGLPQDDAGVWSTPTGARIAWFRDPDGNLLSLTERRH